MSKKFLHLSYNMSAPEPISQLPQAVMMALRELILNDQNPRTIRDVKFDKLVNSVKSFPQMLWLRPIIVDENFVILGGNMRYRACVEAGLSEVPVIIANMLTEDQKTEFIIKDNVGFGEWDYDLLANEWDDYPLDDWGLDLPKMNEPTEGSGANKKYKIEVIAETLEQQMQIYDKLIDLGYEAKMK